MVQKTEKPNQFGVSMPGTKLGTSSAGMFSGSR